MDELKQRRNDLDMCDEILIDALRMRYQIIQEITNYKQKNGLPIYQAEEEERKKSKMLAKLDDYEYKKSIMAVYDSAQRLEKFPCPDQVLDDVDVGTRFDVKVTGIEVPPYVQSRNQF